jgi:hypothetical protein
MKLNKDMKIKKLGWWAFLLLTIVIIRINVIREWMVGLIIGIGFPKEWADDIFYVICIILIFVCFDQLFLKEAYDKIQEELRTVTTELVEIRQQRKELEEKIKEKNKRIRELEIQRETQNLIKTIENEKVELIKQLEVLKRKERKLFWRRLYLKYFKFPFEHGI